MCTTFRSLQLTFTAPELSPANGYRVKWRAVGTVNYTTLSPNPQTLPIVIPQVPVCTNVEGTIETSCGDNNYGAPVSFVVAPPATTPA